MDKYQCLVEKDFNGVEGKCGSDDGFKANIYGYISFFKSIYLYLISLIYVNDFSCIAVNDNSIIN